LKFLHVKPGLPDDSAQQASLDLGGYDDRPLRSRHPDQAMTAFAPVPLFYAAGADESRDNLSLAQVSQPDHSIPG